VQGTIDSYSANAGRLAEVYEGIPFENAHGAWLHFVPHTKSLVLDVGAGSGRDAAWFADQGHEVVAVEPAERLRELGRKLHPLSSGSTTHCRCSQEFTLSASSTT